MFPKYYILLLVLIVPSISFSQDYYWYGHKKISLMPTDNKFVVIKNVDIVTATNVGESATNNQYTNSTTPSWNIISQAEFNNLDQSTLLYSAPSYINQDNNEVFVSHYFYVKLKNVNDSDILQDFAYRNNVKIEYQSTFLPLWYVLSCLNSDRNALDMANHFYESGLFEFAQPDFFSGMDESCSTNDPMFGSQWNLMNTGQYGSEYIGIDINYNGVSQLVPESTDIVVAVVDQGIQLNHPDLAANILDAGYDTETRSSPSVCHGSHGTNCAGIIGAISNNGIGISGIFNGKLMSISNKVNSEPLSILRRAEGVRYAAEHGADIISNSWMSYTRLPAIEEAINYAISYGRNGLGCVVVFASGNSNYSNTLYPSDVNDSIIVVGGISPCGERKSPASCDNNTNWWGSNFGDKLDVVAPCTSIPTTNLMTGSTSAYSSFSGTSAACPHVAAIAGLILSVNPNLTCKQVADIIESTAQKVGGYNYTTTEGRPNGTWHQEVGYGLVDAYAAVLAARTASPHIIGNATLTSQETYTIANLPTTANVKWTYTFTPSSNSTDHMSGNAITFVNGDSTASVVVKRGTYETVEPTLPDPETGIVPLPRPVIKLFAGTVVLKATITSGTNTYVTTKTITLPDITNILPPIDHLDGTTDTIIELATTADVENNSIATHRLRHASPISVDNSVVHIEKLSDAGDDYIPYEGNYTLEVWHDQLGLVERIEDNTPYLYLDCGDMPTGVYQMILIVNEQIVAQSKLLKL